MKVVTLIIAGGIGERFWPKSRVDLPKQFLNLSGSGYPLIYDTAERVIPLTSYDDLFVITGERYKDNVLKALPKIKERNIILEPMGRNTAPAINLALMHIKQLYDEDVVVITLPSDQYIENVGLYLSLIKDGISYLERNDSIITIGIKPNTPNTGYGYIEIGEHLEKEIYKVHSFKEKPSLEVAKEYLSNGGYLWNAGMFIYKLSTMMKAFETYMPKQYETLNRLFALNEKDFKEQYASTFASLDKISIDYGVMEKSNNIAVIKGGFVWDDLGSWLAIDRHHSPDEDGNIVQDTRAIFNNTKNTTVVGKKDKLIVTIGLDNVVIVDTDDVTLIASKDKIDEVKTVLTNLKNNKEDKYV